MTRSATDERRTGGATSWLRGALVAASFAATLGACGISDQGALPPDVQDPKSLHNPAGALALYRATIDTFAMALDEASTQGGVLTDELTTLPLKVGVYGPWSPVDSRQVPGTADRAYARLHQVRAQAREARGFLEAYAASESPALRGHLYAIEGYADVLLADLFCSGIPLSTVDFDANYTLAEGSSTVDVYRSALALLDTALMLTADSARLQQFAAVGKGRTLLALDQYADAAAVVSAVPTDFAYRLTAASAGVTETGGFFEFALTTLQSSFSSPDSTHSTLGASDREGVNGLDYRSSGDPRTMPTDSIGVGTVMYIPIGYPRTGPVNLTAASGIEARLIEAEAALQAGGDWLGIVNQLRETIALPDTTDPGPDLSGGDQLRINLLFRERGFWLYFTGHRQGDLRRLIRQYHREPSSVYPTGTYPGGDGAYGSEVLFQVPESERNLNPKYTGCFNRNA